MGQTVYTVYDGPAALVAVESFRPDVVMLDIGMRHMSGYDVARRLCANASHPVLVAITGWGQREDKQRAYEAGFDYHFAKPVSDVRLQTVLQEIAAPPSSLRPPLST